MLTSTRYRPRLLNAVYIPSRLCAAFTAWRRQKYKYRRSFKDRTPLDICSSNKSQGALAIFNHASINVDCFLVEMVFCGAARHVPVSSSIYCRNEATAGPACVDCEWRAGRMLLGNIAGTDRWECRMADEVCFNKAS